MTVAAMRVVYAAMGCIAVGCCATVCDGTLWYCDGRVGVVNITLYRWL